MYYPPAVPDQLAQLRGQQMAQPGMNQMGQMQNQQIVNGPQTPGNSGTSVIWVPDERSALEYPIAPNSAVVLWDSNSPVIYLKQADASGKPSTQIFDLVERNTAPKSPVQTVQQSNVEYVTREEFNALAARVEAATTRKQAKSKESTKEDDE